MSQNDQFYYENPRDTENNVFVTADDRGGVYVAVSEEKAVDSYNQAFECGVSLDRDAAIRLRDYLQKRFPADDKGE